MGVKFHFGINSIWHFQLLLRQRNLDHSLPLERMNEFALVEKKQIHEFFSIQPLQSTAFVDVHCDEIQHWLKMIKFLPKQFAAEARMIGQEVDGLLKTGAEEA